MKFKLLIAFTFSILALYANAKTLTGYDFYSITFGSGSTDLTDTGSFGISGRYNVADNTDLTVATSWSSTEISNGDTTDGFSAGAGIEYYVQDDSNITPFFGGSLGWAYFDQSQNSSSAYLWETAGFYSLGLGVELSLDNFAIRPYYNHINVIGADYDTIINSMGIQSYYFYGDNFIGLTYQNNTNEAQISPSEEIDSSELILSIGFAL